MHSTQILEEEGGDNQEDVVVVVDLATITKIRIMQKMQVVAEEEETKEQGGVQEVEVAGSSKDSITILMHVGFVADMVTLQMIVTRDLVEGINRETMH